MTTHERYGRISLALAVALLFVTVFISMLSGSLFTIGLVVTSIAAGIGASGMFLARGR
ncbi:MAG TPA: hypothetical protein VMM78_12120 [Thermomicrobiales bacterium]|nr:hypothetical protein [Thermomicrobiales bacterium]